ncbi:oxidoreductase [Meredithblackwellia eburnea MCA 4105]
MGKLSNVVAIVTGGALGLGAGITTKFLAEGAKVVILDWDISPLAKEPARENVKVVQGDVSKLESWKAALDAAQSWGKVSVVVNCAGLVSREKVASHESDLAELDRLMGVNVKGIFASVKGVVPYFLENSIKGAFVNITSVSATRPRPGLAFYTSAATKSLALEYAPNGIRFNGVAPVIANTRMADVLNTKDGAAPDLASRAKLGETIPIGRIAEPSDIANMVAHLACEESSFVTGQIVAVDGGRTI